MAKAQKILFIQDNPTTIESFQKLFEKWRFEIIAEFTCSKRLEQISNSEVDGLLLDLDALEMEGIDMLSNLNHQLIRIPTIVMGSKGTEHLLITALTKGAQDFLLKPIAMDDRHDKCLRHFG